MELLLGNLMSRNKGLLRASWMEGSTWKVVLNKFLGLVVDVVMKMYILQFLNLIAGISGSVKQSSLIKIAFS